MSLRVLKSAAVKYLKSGVPSGWSVDPLITLYVPMTGISKESDFKRASKTVAFLHYTINLEDIIAEYKPLMGVWRSVRMVMFCTWIMPWPPT